MQREAITAATKGTDLLLVSQTGSGKTFCFLLPLLEHLASRSHSIGIVLAPSRELAMQHTMVAKALASSMSDGPAVELLSPKPLSSAAQLLIAQPEHAYQWLHSGAINASLVSTVVIDEVDAILCSEQFDSTLSAMGEALLTHLEPADRTSPPPRYLLTTAHLSPAHEAALSQHFPSASRVQQGSEAGHRPGTLVPSLKQVFHYTGRSKDAKLLSVLRRSDADEWLRGGAALIFCADGATAERLRDLVAEVADHEAPPPPPTHPSEDRVPLPPACAGAPPPEGRGRRAPLVLHEGMPDVAREAVIATLQRRAGCLDQDDIEAGGAEGMPPLLIATGVVARGLDVPSLRHVILFDMPTDVAGFVHCAGRTARRGRPGLVSCLVESQSQASRFRELHALTRAPKLQFEAQALARDDPT